MFFFKRNFLRFPPSFFPDDINVVYSKLHQITTCSIIHIGHVRPEFRKEMWSESRPHSSPDPSCGRNTIAEAGRIQNPRKIVSPCRVLFLEFWIRILLEKSSDFVQETQPRNRIAVFAKIRSVAKRRDGGFRENSPRVFEIQKKRAGREAGVYDEYIIQNFVLRANREANNYQYLT